MTAEPGDNGKITLAIIGYKLDTILARLDNYDKCRVTHESRMSALEIGQSRREAQIINMKEDVDNLQKKSDTWNFGNTVASMVAGLIAIFK
jgi:hypothetical protein